MDRPARILRAVTLAVCVFALAAIVAFGVINQVGQHEQHNRTTQTLKQISGIVEFTKAIEDPSSSYAKQQGKNTQAFVAQIETCLENHADRARALTAHAQMPALLPGCPVVDGQ